MSIPYPEKPWKNGQVFSYKANDGSTVTGIYNSSKNAWTFSRSITSDGGGVSAGGVVTTVDVKTVNGRPEEPEVSPFSLDPTFIGNQRDINWWLYDRLIELDESLSNITITKDRGSWRYTDGPVLNGTFNQFDGADEHEATFANVEKIVLSTFDNTGVAHDFANVQPGDNLEVLSDIGADYGLFVVTGITNTEPTVELEVVHDRSIGKLDFNAIARIKIFSADVELDRPPIIADTAPTEHPNFPGLPLEEGDFWYSTNLLELYIWYNNAWFPTALPASGVSEEVFTYSINRINSIIEEVYLKNIDQDNRLDVLEGNIVELEEEIDAIAPSNERGEWNFNPVGVASPGYYAFLDGNFSVTDRFDAASIIYVSTRSAEGTTHSFNNHSPGEYLQIFNKENDGYGLYVITDIDDNSTSPNPFFAFTVDFVRSLATVPKAKNRGRFKFFTIAEADPGAYVLRTGDEMTGNLTFKDNNQVQTRYLNSGQDSNLEIQRKGETKILVGSDIVQMQKPIKFVSSSFATANEHAIHKGYVDEQINKAVSAAGLQLGEYSYRRVNDSLLTGSIKSNGTTNPKVWTQIDMHTQNKNGVVFGRDFYLKYIVPNMFMRVRDGDNNSTYVAKITEISGISNAVRMVLSPIDSLCVGSFYVDSRYDVSFSYSKHI